jgi:hypothetical protein
MPRLSRPEQLIQDLQTWQDSELLELAAMLQGLIEARQADATDDDPEDERRVDGSPLGKHGGRGHIELKLIPDAKTGKTYGPYRYLRYWGVTKTGRMGLKSLYLGKAAPPE